jgi:hypothetical protein
MFKKDFSDQYQEMYLEEKYQDSIRMEIFADVMNRIVHEFIRRDNEKIIKEIFDDFDEIIGFIESELDIFESEFEVITNSFIRDLLEIVKKKNNISIQWLIGYYFRNHYVDFILNNPIDYDKISLKIIDNLYFLRFSFYKLLIRFLYLYTFNILTPLQKYLDIVNEKILKDYFIESCVVEGDLIVFQAKKYDLIVLELTLKASNHSLVDVNLKDIKPVRECVQKNTFKRNYDEFIISDLIIENIKDRLKVAKGNVPKLKKELTKEQLLIAIKRLPDLLFVKNTTSRQIIALFRADFDYLSKNKLEFKPEYTLGLFGYFIKTLDDNDLFRVYGIYASLDKYQWLIYDEMIITYKEINNKKTDFPSNLKLVDDFISLLTEKNPYKG